ncbi:MAG: hypothetical protein AAFY15_12305 [Cyanobacteria bacterium J06648_11]
MQAGKAIAELKPISSPDKQPRPCGLCAGAFDIPDNSDAPLPENI